MARALALSAALLGFAATPNPSYDPEQARPAMQQIFGSLRQLLPLAVSDGAFEDPANQPTVQAALKTLAQQAELLDSHATGFDPGARFLARSLADDARQALQRYEVGDYAGSEFFLQQTAEACVGCHSHLPTDDSPLAAGFFASDELADLPLLERARLQMATRRFDGALDSLEQALRSPELRPIDLLSPLVDYLTVCVRVERDLKRPIPVMERFSRRDDVWLQLRDDAKAWAGYLAELDARELGATDLGQARALIEEGRSLIVYPSDRRALIHYLVASRILHGIVAAGREPSPQLAEAYYLLGSMESRIGRDFWVSQSAFYLEMAVRMAPQTPLGRQAYALLEEEMLAGYGGSGGVHLPDDVRALLEELRSLIETRQRPGL